MDILSELGLSSEGDIMQMQAKVQQRGIGKYIALGVVAFMAVVIGFGTLFSVSEYERCVVTTFGEYSRTATPGLNVKFPLVQGTQCWRTDLQSLSTPKDLNRGQGESTYTVDNQEVFVVFTVQYRIPPDQIKHIFANVQDLRPRLYQVAQDRLKSELGKVNTSYVAQKRGAIRDDLHTVLIEATKDLGVVIVDFQLNNIEYDETFKNAVKAAASARQTVEQREQERLQAEKTAATAVINAKGKADAVKLQGDAEAYAIRVRGEAEAKAIQAQADALRANPVLVELRKAEKWNGALPTQMIGSVMPWMNVDAAKPGSAK
jgi:regulator of protease activity HflC (stomatin/prohibitin superfamily)